jgi:hypothetical protein
VSEQAHFFATGSDLAPGLVAVEARHAIQYVRAGIFEEATPRIYRSFAEIEDLGVNRSGHHLNDEPYLVMPSGEAVEVREIPQRRGGVRYGVDQLGNQRSIVFRPGGVHGADYLICGHVGTASTLREMARLAEQFSRSVTSGFRQIGAYRVGADALDLAGRGVRLITISTREPVEQDLRVS